MVVIHPAPVRAAAEEITDVVAVRCEFETGPETLSDGGCERVSGTVGKSVHRIESAAAPVRPRVVHLGHPAVSAPDGEAHSDFIAEMKDFISFEFRFLVTERIRQAGKGRIGIVGRVAADAVNAHPWCPRFLASSAAPSMTSCESPES